MTYRLPVESDLHAAMMQRIIWQNVLQVAFAWSCVEPLLRIAITNDGSTTKASVFASLIFILLHLHSSQNVDYEQSNLSLSAICPRIDTSGVIHRLTKPSFLAGEV